MSWKSVKDESFFETRCTMVKASSTRPSFSRMRTFVSQILSAFPSLAPISWSAYSRASSRSFTSLWPAGSAAAFWTSSCTCCQLLSRLSSLVFRMELEINEGDGRQAACQLLKLPPRQFTVETQIDGFQLCQAEKASGKMGDVIKRQVQSLEMH